MLTASRLPARTLLVVLAAACALAANSAQADPRYGWRLEHYGNHNHYHGGHGHWHGGGYGYGGSGFQVYIGGGYPTMYSPYGIVAGGYPSYGYGGYYYGGPYGVTGYGPVYLPQAPLVIEGHPTILGGNPFDNEVLRKARVANNLNWNQPLKLKAQPAPANQPFIPSTPEAQLRSLQLEQEGDALFQKRDVVKAFSRYSDAVRKAEDRPEPHFKLALAAVATSQYEVAVKHLKRGLFLKPDWPTTGIRLDEYFGPGGAIAKSVLLNEAGNWVSEDIRDPDRLFLMGVLLHFDNWGEKSSAFFEAAVRLSGQQDHLVAFLNPAAVDPNAKPNQPALPPPPKPGSDVPEDPPRSGIKLPPLPEPPEPLNSAPKAPAFLPPQPQVPRTSLPKTAPAPAAPVDSNDGPTLVDPQHSA